MDVVWMRMTTEMEKKKMGENLVLLGSGDVLRGLERAAGETTLATSLLSGGRKVSIRGGDFCGT